MPKLSSKSPEYSAENPEFADFMSESRFLLKNPDDLPKFLGCPIGSLFGSQRTLVLGHMISGCQGGVRGRVPKNEEKIVVKCGILRPRVSEQPEFCSAKSAGLGE